MKKNKGEKKELGTEEETNRKQTQNDKNDCRRHLLHKADSKLEKGEHQEGRRHANGHAQHQQSHL